MKSPVTIVLACLAGTAISLAPARAEIPPGKELSRDTWQQAEGMLQRELLEHFKRGEMRMMVAEIPGNLYRLDPDLVEAGEKNIGRFAIGPEGSLVEKATGKVPEFNFGLPFVRIDPSDPNAASEIIWNMLYVFYPEGTGLTYQNLKWLSEGSQSVERQVTIDIRSVAIEGNRIRRENPMQLSVLARNYVLEPSDVQGTQTLSWRFKDPDKEDNDWAYVPALRRIRQVTPTNRADGFLGSEMSQDDGFTGFDAKPETFTFRLLGDGYEYQLFKPQALKGFPVEPDASGQGYRFPATQEVFGYERDGWTGVPWQPIDVVLVKRPVWRIEATPKDPYYLYRRIVFSVDKETYRVSVVSKFDGQGASLNMFVRSITFGRTPSGHYLINVPTGAFWAENLKSNRATAAGAAKGWPYVFQNEPEPFEEYTSEAIVRRGK